MRILFVDKDSVYDELLESTSQDYVVDTASTGSEGLLLCEINSYDAIVVDYSVSDFDISRVCDSKSTLYGNPSVAVITSPCDIESQIQALESGADLYIHRPLTYPLLNAVLKSMVAKKTLGTGPNYVSKNNLSICFARKEVSLNGIPVELRRREYDILEYLVLNKGRVVSKEQLLENVWGPDSYVYSNTIEVQIKNLRDKIDQEKPSQIKTVRGFGYKFIG